MPPVSDASFRYARSALRRPSRFHCVLPRSVSSRFDSRREREPSAATRVSHGRCYRFHLLRKRLAKPSSDARRRRRTFAFSETLPLPPRVSSRSFDEFRCAFVRGCWKKTARERERERDSTDDKIIGATRAKKGRGQILSVARSPFSVERSVQERIPAETCFRLPDAAAIRAQVLRSCGLEAGPFASIGSYRPARSRRGALLTLKPSLPASFTDPLQSLRSFAPFGDANPPPRLFRSTSCSEARCDRRTEWRVRTRFARSIFCVSAGWTRLGGARVRADVSVDGYR